MKDQEEEIKTGNLKYYKKFDFFYARTCFRLMVEFYKTKFTDYKKMWEESKTNSEKMRTIKHMVDSVFPNVLKGLDS